MKKQKWVALVVGLITALGLAGCPEGANTSIVGDWVFTPVGLGPEAARPWSFFPDGTYAGMDVLDQMAYGSYQIDDNGVVHVAYYTWDNEGWEATVSMSIVVNGDDAIVSGSIMYEDPEGVEDWIELHMTGERITA